MTIQQPHIRTNPMTGAQVLVSPHRTQRPWQGKQEEKPAEKQLTYDADCYLCPGNQRAGGQTNPKYSDTFVFVNDYAALLSDIRPSVVDDDILKAHSERGVCKVICFSPNHSETLSQMTSKQIEKVITTWQNEFDTLSKVSYINNIQIFENKGAMMGCSNPHPHGQLWAHETIPNEIRLKTQNFSAYHNKYGVSLLQDYISKEHQAKERIVSENAHFITLVPFWAIWPYELMIIPKRMMKHITEMSKDEKESFAQSISELCRIYDKIFNVSFPYSAGIHQAPVDGKPHTGWHWHMSFYPPLLRSATIKKFMVGYEMFGMPQRDFPPEHAANVLKKIKGSLRIDSIKN